MSESRISPTGFPASAASAIRSHPSAHGPDLTRVSARMSHRRRMLDDPRHAIFGRRFGRNLARLVRVSRARLLGLPRRNAGGVAPRRGDRARARYRAREPRTCGFPGSSCGWDWRSPGSRPGSRTSSAGAVEHDIYGQLVWGIVETFHLTRDLAFLRALWPRVLRAVEAIARLRSRAHGRGGPRALRY